MVALDSLLALMATLTVVECESARVQHSSRYPCVRAARALENHLSVDKTHDQADSHRGATQSALQLMDHGAWAPQASAPKARARAAPKGGRHAASQRGQPGERSVCAARSGLGPISLTFPNG